MIFKNYLFSKNRKKEKLEETNVNNKELDDFKKDYIYVLNQEIYSSKKISRNLKLKIRLALKKYNQIEIDYRKLKLIFDKIRSLKKEVEIEGCIIINFKNKIEQDFNNEILKKLDKNMILETIEKLKNNIEEKNLEIEYDLNLYKKIDNEYKLKKIRLIFLCSKFLGNKEKFLILKRAIQSFKNLSDNNIKKFMIIKTNLDLRLNTTNGKNFFLHIKKFFKIKILCGFCVFLILIILFIVYIDFFTSLFEFLNTDKTSSKSLHK